MNFSLTIFSLLLIAGWEVKAQEEGNWWEKSVGQYSDNTQEFKELMMSGADSKLKGKHVFIYFFMKHCPYCVEFQPKWNDMVPLIKSAYGEGQVAFLLVKQDKNREITKKFGVRGYPSIYYVTPDTDANDFSKFSGSRSYENVYNWMKMQLSAHGAKPIESETPVHSESDEDEFLGDYKEIVNIIDNATGKPMNFTVQTRQSPFITQEEHDRIKAGLDKQPEVAAQPVAVPLVASADVNKDLLAQLADLSSKLKEEQKLVQSLQADFAQKADAIQLKTQSIIDKQNENTVDPSQSGAGESIIYLLVGVIMGSIMTVFGIIFLGKSGALSGGASKKNSMKSSKEMVSKLV